MKVGGDKSESVIGNRGYLAGFLHFEVFRVSQGRGVGGMRRQSMKLSAHLQPHAAPRGPLRQRYVARLLCGSAPRRGAGQQRVGTVIEVSVDLGAEARHFPQQNDFPKLTC